MGQWFNHPHRNQLCSLAITLVGATSVITICAWDVHHKASHHTPYLHNTSLTTHTLEPEINPEIEHDGIHECTILLENGRKITGAFIREDSDSVTVSINKIETRFLRKDIASIKMLAPISRRYREMRAAIPDDDIDTRLSLVEWLRERKAYRLALIELDSILLIDPFNPHAKTLHTWLSEYTKLRSDPKDTQDIDESERTNHPADTRAPKTKPNIPQANSFDPLTKEQINLIRVFEIDLRSPPKLKIPDETINTLIRRHPNAFPTDEHDRKKLLDLPEIQKLRLLFEHKARDLYSQVQVLEDPEALETFRKQVLHQRGWIINACASTRCHGGNQAGEFRLLNTKPNSIETSYTNFVILENYTLSDGSSLINYDAPERSPLLQMGMIEKNSVIPHPPIEEKTMRARFRPIFKSTRDRKFRDTIEWIRSMYQPRPDYSNYLNTQTKDKITSDPQTPPTKPEPEQSDP